MTQAWTGLLSEKDLETVREALRRRKRIEVERETRGLRVRVSTGRAAPVWGAAMTVRLEVWRPGIYSTQRFGGVEEMLKHG